MQMSISTLEATEILQNGIYTNWPKIDVRSPSEFAKGHVPNALNIPLFSNEERSEVGTTYKKLSREEAIKIGLRRVGPKLEQFVETAENLVPQKKMILYCWRGGMRSSAMAWLFSMAGFDIILVKGGYKAIRTCVLEYFLQPFQFILLSGYTGSGKTEVLHRMKDAGAQVLDLEKLAQHKGSAFGSLGMKDQPNQEQFENLIFDELKKFDLQKPIWVEDESRMIGRCCIPTPLYNCFKSSPLVFMSVPLAQRVQRLVIDYAGFEKKYLEASVSKIAKKLGPQNTKDALQALESGHYDLVATIVLRYYDKCYTYDLHQHSSEKIRYLETENWEDPLTIQKLFALEKQFTFQTSTDTTVQH